MIEGGPSETRRAKAMDAFAKGEGYGCLLCKRRGLLFLFSFSRGQKAMDVFAKEEGYGCLLFSFFL